MKTSAITNTEKRTKCEIYTRVMGYYRPVSHFNIGKKSEFYSRNYFKEHNINKDTTPNQSFNKLYNNSCS